MSNTDKVLPTNLRYKCPIESCTTKVLSAEWLAHLFEMHVRKDIKSVNYQTPGIYRNMEIKLNGLDLNKTYIACLILCPVRKSLALTNNKDGGQIDDKHLPVLLCMRKLVRLAQDLPEDWNRIYYFFWLIGTCNAERMWAHVHMGGPAGTTKQPIVLAMRSFNENQNPEHFEANELLALSQDDVDLWQHEDKLKISLAILE